MNAYELATVEDAAIQYAKAVPHACRQPSADPTKKAYFKEQTADAVLAERGFHIGARDSEGMNKWHELVREVTRIGSLMAKGKYEMTTRLRAKAKRMRDGGKTLTEIGAKLGYAHTTIGRNLR